MNRITRFSLLLAILIPGMQFSDSASAALAHTITSASDIAVTSPGYTADGTLDLTLGFAPAPGTNLTVVKNTGTAFISGTFNNAAHGATVPLTYNGVTYNFIANYYGGNGRSLVLHWPLTKISSWGSNQYRQLGNGGVRDQTSPVSVRTDGVLSGKTVTKIVSGHNHSFALTSEGRIYGWGDNSSNQLANDISGTGNVPVAVHTTGVLAGKTIVDIAANRDFSAALDSTGKAYTWGGANTFGELGIGSNNQSLVPVPVDTSGVLSGKTLVAISAGMSHMLALSSEGKVYTWGDWAFGSGSTVPVSVSSTGELSGKSIVSIAAGSDFSLALSSDGRVYAWGYNSYGQLGTGNHTGANSPVAVDMTGALAGKTVAAIAAGSEYGLALTSEGKVYGWGIGIFGHSSILTPTEIDPVGSIAGKTIVAISSKMALASDGTVYSWQSYSNGQSVISGLTGPTLAIANGENHWLALMPQSPPIVARHPANVTAAEGATASFNAVPGNQYPANIHWQVSTAGVGGPFVDILGNPTASTMSLNLDNVTSSQNGSAYRAVFSTQSGSSVTNPAVLTLVSWTANYTSASDTPFQNNSFAVSGPINLQLSFAPAPGTNLMLLKNTGTSFIAGEFSNLPHGSTIPLTFNGTTYNYVANYYGGSNGRCLVLQWPLVRMAAWGENRHGELGDGTVTQRIKPVQVIANGSLAGKTIVKVCANLTLSMALTSEGKLFVWGEAMNGKLGNGDTYTDQPTPFELTAAGPLAGKFIISMSAGTNHCLALTREGEVYAWGGNLHGQLGVGYTGSNIPTPVALDVTVLFGGKPVVAVSAGSDHSLALTTDGRVYAWGNNSSGKTGIGTSSGDCLLPMEIATAEDLGDLPIVSIAAGASHSLVLAADGSLFAWGTTEEIGNNGIYVFGSTTPSRVDASGVLSGKSVTDLTASGHNLILADNGSFISSWGYNTYGQLGTGDSATRLAPALVETSGSLAGKTVTSLACGYGHSLATTSDGKCYAWGLNDHGQLGNDNTTNSNLPGEVAGTGAASQMIVMSIAAGSTHSLAIVDQGPPVITLQPSNLTAGAGASVTFKAKASDPFGYRTQWQISTTGPGGPFTNITDNPTATNSALNLPSVSTSDHGNTYRAVFYTNSGSVTTRSVTLHVVNWTATFNSADAPAFEADGVIASGTMNLNLGFAPIPGTTLTVVKNTGLSFIDGTFSNIPQGGKVTLTYNGIPYDFIANYFGGNDGRSLVLQWPWTKLAAWGYNADGQLADGSLASRSTPVISNSSEFTGKCILKLSAGSTHSLALTADGRIIGWGNNTYGQAGAGGNPAGPLDGKTVAAVSAGSNHSLAVCSDGTAYAWGQNFAGMLGNGSTTNSSVPVPVYPGGVLAGKSLTAVAAGTNHSLALSSDGRVFSWGFNVSGRLGNGTYNSSSTPVAVDDTGVLAGKSITAISAGDSHSVALSTDGSVYTWGSNTNGELGGNSTSDRFTPVEVATSGVLSGKSVIAIAAGNNHTLALTSDGKVHAWGDNTYGQLGNGGTTDSLVPIDVTITPELTGKTVIAVAAGARHSMALTSDGLVFCWGYNPSGQLGNGTTVNSSIPVPASTSGILSGRKVMTLDGGGSHSMAVYAGDSQPVLVQQPASQTLMYAPPANNTVSLTAHAVDVFPLTVQWQESPGGASGPFSDIVGNSTAQSETLVLENFPSTKNGYAYRAVFTNGTQTVSSNPATLAVNALGPTLHFPNNAQIPISTSASNIQVKGAPTVTLGFAPTPGTDLTLIANAGTNFLAGSFENLIQGSVMPLSFDGVTHDFVVDYYGGNGRSLVLHWSKTRITTWGDGSNGKLGNGGGSRFVFPFAVSTSGVLSGQTVFRASSGSSHNLALTSNGTLVAWGYNNSGQLGIGTTTDASSPTSVYAAGQLSGKRVVGIAAGESHSLALTSEGRAYAWGSNGSGRLGNGTTTTSAFPVAVDTSGVLAGRSLVAIASGGSHSIALASDGRLVAWGNNLSGQLGDGTSTSRTTPVNVIHSGALSGRIVSAIAAGTSHTLALTSDGRVYGWGYNAYGQLGPGGGSTTPVAQGSSGLIAGKTVTAIAAGANHNLALTSDGMVYAWGLGTSGQLGNSSTSSSTTPVAVTTSGVLAGKTVVKISAGANHSLAITSDGKVHAWGLNDSGQLGNNSLSNSSSPVAVTTSTGSIGGRMSNALAAGALHSLAVCGTGTASVVVTPPSSVNIPVNGTARFTAAATGYPAPTVRWQQSTTGPTGTFANITGNATATTNTLEIPNASIAQNGYSYRAVFSNIEGNVNSAAATLGVANPPTLSLPGNITTSASLANGAVVSFSVTATDSLDGSLVPTCSPASGSVFPIGTTTVTCSAGNSLGITTTGTFTVTVLNSFVSFLDANRLPADSPPSADPHHTGIPNLIAYAFGLNPISPDRSQMPTVIVAGGHLRIAYTRRKDAPDISYLVETSDTLESWESSNGTTQVISVTPLDANRERVVEETTTPIAGSSTKYARVRISTVTP